MAIKCCYVINPHDARSIETLKDLVPDGQLVVVLVPYKGPSDAETSKIALDAIYPNARELVVYLGDAAERTLSLVDRDAPLGSHRPPREYVDPTNPDAVVIR